jgi:hypothetical protein
MARGQWFGVDCRQHAQQHGKNDGEG